MSQSLQSPSPCPICIHLSRRALTSLLPSSALCQAPRRTRPRRLPPGPALPLRWRPPPPPLRRRRRGRAGGPARRWWPQRPAPGPARAAPPGRRSPRRPPAPPAKRSATPTALPHLLPPSQRTSADMPPVGLYSLLFLILLPSLSLLRSCLGSSRPPLSPHPLPLSPAIHPSSLASRVLVSVSDGCFSGVSASGCWLRARRQSASRSTTSTATRASVSHHIPHHSQPHTLTLRVTAMEREADDSSSSWSPTAQSTVCVRRCALSVSGAEGRAPGSHHHQACDAHHGTLRHRPVWYEDLPPSRSLPPPPPLPVLFSRS